MAPKAVLTPLPLMAREICTSWHSRFTSSCGQKSVAPPCTREPEWEPYQWQSCGSRCAQRHSIASSARASRAGEIASPSAFAVFRLMTSSNRVGCSDGQVGRPGALENLVHIGRGAPEKVSQAGTVAHEAPGLYVLPPNMVGRRAFVASSAIRVRWYQ